jgi:hypothetical protein
MKKLTAAIFTTVFAASAGAADVYHGLDAGNSDLSAARLSAEDFVGVQPNVGDNVSRYQGWDEGNPDLFKAEGSQSRTSTGQPDIYMNVSGNPDLQF